MLLALAIAAVSVTVILFYLSRPQIDRNYGGHFFDPAVGGNAGAVTTVDILATQSAAQREAASLAVHRQELALAGLSAQAIEQLAAGHPAGGGIGAELAIGIVGHSLASP